MTGGEIFCEACKWTMYGGLGVYCGLTVLMWAYVELFKKLMWAYEELFKKKKKKEDRHD